MLSTSLGREGTQVGKRGHRKWLARMVRLFSCKNRCGGSACPAREARRGEGKLGICSVLPVKVRCPSRTLFPKMARLQLRKGFPTHNIAFAKESHRKKSLSKDDCGIQLMILPLNIAGDKCSRLVQCSVDRGSFSWEQGACIPQPTPALRFLTSRARPCTAAIKGTPPKHSNQCVLDLLLLADSLWGIATAMHPVKVQRYPQRNRYPL